MSDKVTQPLRVLDFSKAPSGMVVVRSEHWNRTRYVKRGSRKQMGVITNHKFYQDSRGIPICWPVVHWEGNVSDSITHPVLVAPFRKSDAALLPAIDMYDLGD
jgi:hypothetical protein